jgi:hypothetical protein
VACAHSIASKHDSVTCMFSLDQRVCVLLLHYVLRTVLPAWRCLQPETLQQWEAIANSTEASILNAQYILLHTANEHSPWQLRPCLPPLFLFCSSSAGQSTDSNNRS